MYFFFDNIPAIKDKTDLTKLVKEKEVSGEIYEKIKHAQHLREQYAQTMNMDKISELAQLQDGLVNYKYIMEEYLKTNVDMLEYIGYNKSSSTPKFEYETFISKKHKTYTTCKLEKPEAFAAELLMVRYVYAFAYQMDSFPFLLNIKNWFLSSINPNINPLDYCSEQVQQQRQTELNSVISGGNNALDRIRIGYERIVKVHNLISDLLYFLVQKQQILIPELKATTLYCVKLLFEINANTVYLEQLIGKLALKEDNNYKIAQLAKTNVSKLKEIQSRFNDIKEEINDDMFMYLNLAIPYFQALGMVYLSKHNENNMKNDIYPEGKNHSTMSGEQLALGQYIMNDFNYIYQQKPQRQDFHQLPFAKEIATKLFHPVGSKLVQIHGYISSKISNVPSGIQLLLAIPSLDYFENIEPLK